MVDDRPPEDAVTPQIQGDSRWDSAFRKVKKGGDIDSDLATLATNACTTEPDPKFLELVKEKYPIPSNTPYVVAPSVTKGVFYKLSSGGRSTDDDLRKHQEHLATGIHATLYLGDKIAALKRANPEDAAINELYEGAREAIYLLGHSSYQSSIARREKMRGSFKKEYKPLCNKDRPITDDIFGGGFSEECEGISKAAKATNAAFFNGDKRRDSRPSNSQGRAGNNGNASNSNRFRNDGGGKWSSSSSPGYKKGGYTPYQRGRGGGHKGGYNKGGHSNKPFNQGSKPSGDSKNYAA